MNDRRLPYTLSRLHRSFILLHHPGSHANSAVCEKVADFVASLGPFLFELRHTLAPCHRVEVQKRATGFFAFSVRLLSDARHFQVSNCIWASISRCSSHNLPAHTRATTLPPRLWLSTRNSSPSWVVRYSWVRNEE